MWRTLLLLGFAGTAFAQPALAEGAGWLWPVHGQLIRNFHTVSNPFIPGQHRGIDIAASAGTTVRSACAGRVVFSGTVPDRRQGVSAICGELRVVYLGLAEGHLQTGQRVLKGERVGTLGQSENRSQDGSDSPSLYFSVRRNREPFGYLNPLLLLDDPKALRVPDLVPGTRPAPRGRAPRNFASRRVDPESVRLPSPVPRLFVEPRSLRSVASIHGRESLYGRFRALPWSIEMGAALLFVLLLLAAVKVCFRAWLTGRDALLHAVEKTITDRKKAVRQRL